MARAMPVDRGYQRDRHWQRVFGTPWREVSEHKKQAGAQSSIGGQPLAIQIHEKYPQQRAACHGQQRQHRRSFAGTLKLSCVCTSHGSYQCFVIGGWFHTSSSVHPLGIEPSR